MTTSLDPAAPNVPKRKPPVLVFGRWRLPLSAEDADRLEGAIARWCEANGSTYGLASRLVRLLEGDEPPAGARRSSGV